MFINNLNKNGEIKKEYNREKLIKDKIKLVNYIVNRNYFFNKYKDELISVGTIGLIKAIDTFKFEKYDDKCFNKYAFMCIKSEMFILLRKYEETYKNEIPINYVIGINNEGDEIYLIDYLFDYNKNSLIEDIESKIQNGIFLEKINKLLTHRENSVISLRFGLVDGNPRSQHEVVRCLNIPVIAVSRLERKALMVLRKKLKYFK